MEETKKEPTTAELVSAVREVLEMYGQTHHGTALPSLSELERRMGATERAAKDAIAGSNSYCHAEDCAVEDEYDSNDTEGCVCFHQYIPALSAALTDAPSVFTLEEVIDAMLDAGKDMKGDDTPADFRDYVSARLAALRR